MEANQRLLFLEEKMNNNYFVSPEWVNELIESNTENFVILDMPYGKFEYEKDYDDKKRLYEDCHIPGAIKITKSEFESKENDLNINAPESIEEMLLSKGIDSSTELIIYSDGVIAASRVALIALWAGVENVKIMLGGIRSWIEKGFPIDDGVVTPEPKKNFGVKVPANPQYIISTPEDVVNEKEKNPDLVLASVRSWSEFVGDDSGYTYVDLSGSPAGSSFAKASTHRTNVEELLDDNGNFGDLQDIYEEWKNWGISPDKEVAFYCGAGWRAATAFFVCLQKGWDNVKVYDGGWYQWKKYYQDNPQRYPIQNGNPKDNTLKIIY